MERIGAGVDRELSRYGTAGQLTEVVRAWAEAAGPAVARNAFPARLSRDGVLHVSTSSSTWAFELSQLASTLQERLEIALGAGAPRVLRFAVGPVPELAPTPEPAPPPAEPSSADEERAARLVASVDDEELRALVARAAALSLARAASDRAF